MNFDSKRSPLKKSLNTNRHIQAHHRRLHLLTSELLGIFLRHECATLGLWPAIAKQLLLLCGIVGNFDAGFDPDSYCKSSEES